ncbi:Na+/H+ antiporter [Solimonas fluminis]|uniref:Na+/H+ antiporter n=1 Tax=Solimonas fluminis TaxID=2086571 RepID=A0A2S5TBN1_9GAMM|nr:Na+/H+ antiporter [Solimonas fluminis]PPE72375.1 Na+/H+ antiporter [Solimonas fluminis]
MQSIEVVLAMLLAVLASGYLVRLLPFSLPLPLVQIGLGAVISGVFNQGVVLNPEVFFLLFLPPLLFLDGWRIPKSGLFRDRGVILQLALGLVLFTVVGAGFMIHWLIPTIPLPVAFALAAIISPTDPVAVSSIAARAPIPKRIMHILEGESLLNDASGLVCFRFAVAAAMTGGFSLASASLTFLWLALAGLAIGVLVTLGISRAQNWLSRHVGEESGSPILVSLLTPFGAYLLAEHLEASGILAAVAAGITMSRVELSGRALPTTRVQRAAVWDTVQFALNGIMFVLLGEQLPGILRDAADSVQEAGHLDPWWLAIYALAISAGLALLRLAWVWGSLHWSLLRARQRGERPERPHWRLVAAMSLAGVRGAITLAGVLTLPLLLPDGSPFPARDLVVFLAAAVILLSLVMASLVLPRVLQGLELPPESTEHQEEDHARMAAARKAVRAIERAQRELPTEVGEAEAYASAAARLLALYQKRLHDVVPTGTDPAQLRLADKAERALRLAALQAEREAIFALARNRMISDEISRKLVREIDLLESRYR